MLNLNGMLSIVMPAYNEEKLIYTQYHGNIENC